METEHLKNMGLKLISAVSSGGTDHPSPTPLLQSLEETAQKCFVLYGNKRALATEQDPCVLALCEHWLRIISHGLKIPISVYHPIQAIVTAGLNYAFNLNLFDVRLWNYTKLHLTKHEEDRFKLLNLVKTPLGYFRSFLRSALNEKSLQRYLQSWISHDSLCEYYEDWAFMRDMEKANILLDIATKLSSIYFALSIDKIDLNDSLQVAIDVVSIPEPIIAVNTPMEKSKANKKIQREIMSFDSDTSDSGEKCDTIDKQINESKSKSQIKCTSHDEGVYLSEQNSLESPKEALSRLSEKMNNIFFSQKKTNSESESHQESDVSSTIDDGKKKSESEINEVFLSDNISCLELRFGNEHFEMDDANLSNLLLKEREKNTFLKLKISQINSEFKERSSRMEDAFLNLTRENDRLKDQLRIYLSAVEKLGDNSQSKEIEHYEAKLVQVAQMHAELMEFNDMLQKQLQRQIEPFGIHYPLSSFMAIPNSSVNIWIPSTYLITKNTKSFHVYQVFLKIAVDEWNVYRRYSEFHQLYNDLKNSHPDISSFKFPPKKALGKKDAYLVEQRRNQLQAWLRHIIHTLPQLHQSTNRDEFIRLVPFFGTLGNCDYSSILRPLPTP